MSSPQRKRWTLDELLARADVSGGPDSCWPWKGNIRKNGYGEVGIYRGERFVHRLVFELANGFMPEAVCHRCDNPPCINPTHLRAGTRADNTAEMWAKGRARPRGRIPLTLDQRRAIQTATGSQGQIAKRFDVSQQTVSRIRLAA